MLSRPLITYPVFHVTRPSLLRGNLLVVVSFLAAIPMSNFPESRRNPFLVVPSLLAVAGLVETIRCMRSRWSFYHGGVLLCVYMDLMAISVILFFLLSPYMM